MITPIRTAGGEVGTLTPLACQQQGNDLNTCFLGV